MNVTKVDYKLEKFNEENVESLLRNIELDANNYFIAMTKPSTLNTFLAGYFAEFSNRYCVFCFSETELNIIILSGLGNKNVREIIEIKHDEITNIKLSNILISYMLNMKASGSSMKFQVFKKVGGFKKVKNSIELFKKMYLN